MSQVLLLADDPQRREFIARLLSPHATITEDASHFDIAIVVGDLAQIQVAQAGCSLNPVIVVGPDNRADTAVKAMKHGAFDYLPFSEGMADRLMTVLEHARQFAAEPAQLEADAQLTFVEALYDSAAALTSTLDLEEVLDRILANLARVIPYDTGAVMLVDGKRARMVRNRRSTQPNQQIEQPMVEFDIDHMPTLRTMGEQRDALLISDTRQYDGWVALAQSAWVCAFLGVPIMEADAVIGFVTLNSAIPHAFDSQHAARLQAFSNHVSIALRNARLFDTTQRYAAELEQRVQARTAELNRERDQLKAILDSTGEGILYTADDRIQYVNRAVTEMTGYSAAQLVDHAITALNPDGELAGTWSGILDRVRSGAATWRDEVEIRRSDGSVFVAGLTVSRWGQADDDPLHTVTVLRDISQEKALEDQKSRFIATASHELRTPITNMRTRLYLVKHQPQRMDDHLEVMNSVVLRMQKLVEDLLDQSRFERGLISLDKERIRLQDLIVDVLHTQQAEAHLRGIELSADLAEAPLYVMADPDRLEQVLTNLITNALLYTPQGGQVRVELSMGEMVNISICDTGGGIPADQMAQIFDPFVRATDTASGTGLGLSIAKQIVDLHGGEIHVESSPGEGSCFSVLLQDLGD